MRRLSRTSWTQGLWAVALSAVAAASVEAAEAQGSLGDHVPASRAERTRSRADQEAEQRVSLSADKIIEILRREPGLLLEVKKELARRAYAQGRILDGTDLTDEALFRLLREDNNIRVLATREIEDRHYVRAKPTPRELEQGRELAEERGLVRAPTPSPTSDRGRAKSSEGPAQPGRRLLGQP
jgi:hypothetical protein